MMAAALGRVAIDGDFMASVIQSHRLFRNGWGGGDAAPRVPRDLTPQQVDQLHVPYEPLSDRCEDVLLPH